MSFTVVIPARYGSSRFPGKPLALIDGKPMIQHVVERAKEAGAITSLLPRTMNVFKTSCLVLLKYA